jgi:hypothetical protein
LLFTQFVFNQTLSAQEISLDKAGFTDATMSIAGPDKIYIRGIRYGGNAYSLLLEAQDRQGAVWKAAALYNDEENVAPEKLILDFVKISAVGSDRLRVSGIILEGQSYAATFQFSGETSMAVTDPLEQAPMPEGFTEKIGELKGMLVELERDRYEQKIEELERENETQQNRISELREKLSSYEDELTALKTELAEERDRATEPEPEQAEPNEARDEDRDRALAELAEAESQIESYKETISAQEKTINALREEKTGLEEVAKELAITLEEYETEIEQLRQAYEESKQKPEDFDETEIEKIEEVHGDVNKTIEEIEDKNEALQWEIAILRFENAQKDALIKALREENRDREEQLKELSKDREKLLELNEELEQQAKKGVVPDSREYKVSPSLTEIRRNLNNVLLEGFGSFEPQLGNWKITEDEAFQLDGDQYFAKLVFEVEQYSRPTLFSFKARALGDGWVGVGMHIFATNKEKLKGYGFGKSLLVWMTRDPEYYESNDTRLQLYRSDNNIDMEQVLDAVVMEPMTRYQQLDIYYQPVEQYITIYINGEAKLAYKTWFDIDNGIEVALRSLGTGISFKDPVVRTTK